MDDSPLLHFEGDGKVRDMLRQLDWEASALGAPPTWPAPLKTAVDMMLNSAFPMFVAWGPDLGFLYNDAYAVILGEKHPAALGGRFQHIWAEIWSDIEPIIVRALANKSTYFEDLPLTVVRRGYPEPCFFTFSYSPLHDDAGRVGGMYCTVMETTSRVLAEQKLRAADQRKDDFLAMLAHELRNPLAPIASAAELLSRTRLDEKVVRQSSAIIGRQVKHMTGLVDDLLDVSRVTHGLVVLSKAPVAVRTIVDEAVEQVSQLLQTRRQPLVVRLPPDDTIVLGDKRRMVQILVNLLQNSAKYSADERRIDLHAEVDGEELVIAVRDEGIGMSAELMPHVFDLFTQAESSSARSLGGLGLGLSLVKQLVELHDGKVSCSSPGLGKGSSFVVRLPLAPSPALARPHHAGTPPTAHAPLKVMIVDDNADAAQMLAMLLSADGHDVIVEYGSVSALARARLERPAVCLLDIGLPEMDGNELARHLLSQPETAGAKLIAITGYGQHEDRLRTAQAGFHHHLVKPIAIKQLAGILSELAGSPTVV
ncbi:MAG TPA: ATP-binding protein [Duganella sp.]|jgi:signal transduction histidine kinase/ActR/RegA family two-component response regulator